MPFRPRAGVVLGTCSPEFNSLVTLVISQLVCLLPVGILNHVMLYYFCFFICFHWPYKTPLGEWLINYRLTHSVSALAGFTGTSSLTMNEKFQYRMRLCECDIKNFEFIVSERVQVNTDNSQAMSALTFLLFKLNTKNKEIVKL